MKPTPQAVTEHPFTLVMNPEHARILAMSAQRRTFQTGDILFKQGQPANDFYLIESGCVALEGKSKSGHSELQSIGPGEALGWSWLFPPFVWHFQARATSPTEALVFSGGQLLEQAARHPDFGYELMKRVAKVVINRLQTARTKALV